MFPKKQHKTPAQQLHLQVTTIRATPWIRKKTKKVHQKNQTPYGGRFGQDLVADYLPC
jgi:hypothetical protein